jgi:hypothetical protein
MASEIPGLVVDAARHGVTMKLDGGKLLLRADTPPPAALLDRIRENTAALIRHLEFASGSGGEPSDPAEVFADNVRKSLRVHSEILDDPFDPEDFRMARIKSDTATAVLNVASRGSTDQLRVKRDERSTSPRLMERVIEARRILAFLTVSRTSCASYSVPN